MRRFRSVLGVGVTAAAMAVLAVPLPAGAADSGRTTRVSVRNPTGADPTGDSSRANVSADGHYVVFESTAHNLVAGDPRTRGNDVYWVDRRDPAGTLTKVSTVPGGGRPTGNSHLPTVSADGRYVVFSSDADNLVVGRTTPGRGNVYRRDMTRPVTAPGAVVLVSVTTNGGAPTPGYSARPTVSADGSRVEFYSQACNLVAGVCPPAGRGNLFLRDLATATTRVLTRSATRGEPNGDTVRAELSGTGTNVVFESAASNLVGGDTNGVVDIFRVDVASGAIERVSVGTGGSNPSGASGRPTTDRTGRYLAFESWASNLVPGDTNGKLDAFVYDTAARRTTRVSLSAAGAQLSAPSSRPALSGDGAVVSFATGSGKVVPADRNHARDVFLRDWQAASPTTVRASVSVGGGDGGCGSGPVGVDTATRPSLSADGSVLAFVSGFCNLTAGDTNGADDVFARVWPTSPF